MVIVVLNLTSIHLNQFPSKIYDAQDHNSKISSLLGFCNHCIIMKNVLMCLKLKRKEKNLYAVLRGNLNQSCMTALLCSFYSFMQFA